MTERFDSNSSLGSLIERLERQARLAQALTDVARRQAALIEQCEGDALLGLLNQRDELIDAIDRGHSDIAACSIAIEEKLSAASPEARDQIASLIQTVQSRLAEVLQVDAMDAVQINDRLAHLRTQLRQADHAAVARSAYEQRSPSTTQCTPSPKFTDRQA